MRMKRKALGASNTLRGQLGEKSRRRRERIDALANAQAFSIRNDPLPALELVHLRPDQVRIPARALRKKDPAHDREVLRAIDVFGFCEPVLIGKHNEVLNGIVRVRAAQLRGMETIPCIRIDHLDETQQRLLRLAVNRLGEKGAWDLDELKVEFTELIIKDAPIEVTGFSLDEIDHVLLDDDSGIESGELEPASGAIASARKGDVFLLGKHKVSCGSATDASLVQALFANGATAQFVFTDEPYNVPIVGHVTGGAHREFEMASGEMSPAEYAAFNEGWMSAVLPHLKDGGVLATFIDWRGYPTVHAAATKLGLAPLNLVVWTKTNAGQGSQYRSQHELLPMFKKGAGPVVNNVELGKRGRWRSNVWTYAGASSLGSDARRGLKEHPTVKPTAMLEDALLDLTNRGDVVVDPFLGSGSTLIAAESTGRICVGVEIDPLYVDLILRRYQEATGQSATLEATGESFAEVVERRAQETASTRDADAPARDDFEGRTSVRKSLQADSRSPASEESSVILPG